MDNKIVMEVWDKKSMEKLVNLMIDKYVEIMKDNGNYEGDGVEFTIEMKHAPEDK